MKRFILGFILAISIPVMAAVLWPSGSYLETFQNGFIFGTGKVLSVLNDVITFDGNRLDDRNKDIFYQEDFEGASVSFACGTDLTAADETAAPIKGTSKSFTQGATPPAVGVKCESAAITLSPKEQDKNIVEVCFNSEWNGNNNEMALNIYGNTSAANLVQVPITASSTPKKHCGYFTTSGEASIDYHIEVLTQNANKILLVDSIQFKVDPLAPTDLYASSEWEDAGAITILALPGGTAPTKGTTTVDKFYCRRDGSDLIINMQYKQTALGANGSTDYRFEIPSSCLDGAVINTSLTGTFTTAVGVGPWAAYNGIGSASAFLTGGVNAVGRIIPYDETTFRIGVTYNAGGTPNRCILANSCYGLANPAVEFSATARIPIAGWSDKAQGVVVKNRTDNAAHENVFSAKISGGGVISEENIDWIDGDCTVNADTFSCPVNAGLFSTKPNCVANTQNASGQQTMATFNASASSNSALIISFTLSTNGAAASPVAANLICQRQGTDYIKETDKVYTVPVDTLTGNSCRLEGNDGRAITANTESVPFDDISACPVGWTSGADGSTTTNGNYYEVQKNNSVVRINGSVFLSAAASFAVQMHLNGTLYKQLNVVDNSDTTSSHHFNYESTRGEFSATDKIAFIVTTTGNVSNATTLHYLNITEEYGDRGIFLGTLPTDLVTTKYLTGNVSVTGDLSDLTFTGLEVGKWYEVTGAISNSSINVANGLRFRSGASGTGDIYHRWSSNLNTVDSSVYGVHFKFKASSTSMYVNGYTINGTIVGSNSTDDTYLMLTEANSTR